MGELRCLAAVAVFLAAAAPNDPGGRTLRCENEADILGLGEKWREAHVRACLARKPAARGR